MSYDGEHQPRRLDDEGLTERERAIIAATCGELLEHAESIFGCDGATVADVAVLPDGRLAVFEPDGDRMIYFARDARTGAEVIVAASASYVRSADPQTGATVAELLISVPT